MRAWSKVVQRRVVAGSLIGVVAMVAAACTSTTTGAPISNAGAASASSPASSASVPVTTSAVISSPAATTTAQSSPAPSTSSSTTESSTESTTSSSAPAPKPTVSADPGFGATDLSPSEPISIKVAHGTISTLSFTNPTGKQVTGALSADKSTWTLGEVLGYGKTYTIAGTAVGADGKHIPIAGSYTTLPSADEADSTISPGDGQTVGVAESVIIRFPAEPVDKADIEKHLTITTTPHVDGSWAWIQHDDAWGVDWRPQGYWPADTKVHVSANLYGLKIADGMYGSEDLTTDFTVGRSQVVYADANAHDIVVKQGCSTTPGQESSCSSTVATYPASFGKGDIQQNITRSGIHVVMEKDPTTVMVGTPPANYRVTEYWAVRISDNGEFIHENPNTVGDQGNTNVSNGCINLSPTSAKAYFNSALIGDPVEVTGTSVQLSAADGDMFDYTIPWSEWLSLSALHSSGNSNT